MPLISRLSGLVFALSTLAPLGALAQSLPPEVEAALARANVPRDAVTMLVADTEGTRAPRLTWRAQAPVNPASIMKLVTTYAALDLLGPAFTWTTPVYIDGPVNNGVLTGNLYIRGQGDPKLVIERLWLLLRRVQGFGIQSINGDIVLDRSAFEVPESNPAAFDGESLRPYNAAPDALLINFKSVVMTFVPNPAAQTAQVSYAPMLAGVTAQAKVPLTPGDCNDWRAGLGGEFSDPARIAFTGGYPAACGEKVWPVAYPQPRNYAARAISGVWAEMGGHLKGTVREGRVPAELQPVFETSSPPLAEVIRDINKYSNNVMAQQLFLTLGLQQKQRGDLESARATVRQWWSERIGTGAGESPPTLDNGSGLSRNERITAAGLAKMLQVAWHSPWMPELAASLPITGMDGTLRKRALLGGASVAHLKTGTLRDAAGVAGYVDAASGHRYVVIAIANHANAVAARPAFDALVEWAARE
jgi:D-alanyl-D-alanine carboxypeptidase/D-alanyl-D-alanine-endopeptidase (penicillin-binding protein 4)